VSAVLIFHEILPPQLAKQRAGDHIEGLQGVANSIIKVDFARTIADVIIWFMDLTGAQAPSYLKVLSERQMAVTLPVQPGPLQLMVCE
jgi:hypothetical protein